MKAPLSTTRNMGFIPSKSRLIWSATVWTLSSIFSWEIYSPNSLSKTFTVFIFKGLIFACRNDKGDTNIQNEIVGMRETEKKTIFASIIEQLITDNCKL